MRRYIMAMAALAAVSGLTATAQAAVLVNGSFELGSPKPAPGTFSTVNAVDSTTITGWTVSNDSVDWVHDGYWEAQDGDYSIDLAGTGDPSENGWIEQTFGTNAGTLYTVTYYLAGNPEGGFDPGKNAEISAHVNGTQIQLSSITGIQGASTSDMNWEKKIFQFTAQGATSTLRFASTENSQFGAAIDNVSISPIPEPATWAMMIAGFGLVGGAMRRRTTVRTVFA